MHHLPFKPLHRLAIVSLSLLALAAGHSAHAQATIDQAKVMAGGVTPGDGPGFPLTLSAPGTYKLTGNLIVPGGQDGILVSVPNVTIDLNGFSIIGPGVCSRNAGTGAVTCVGATGTKGIDANSQLGGSDSATTIMNGTVRGFIQGIGLQSGRLERVNVMHNNGYGVTSGGVILVERCYAHMNASTGFSLTVARVTGSVSSMNGGSGFTGQANVRNLVQDSSALDNGIYGFYSLAVGGTIAAQNKSANYLWQKAWATT
nr:hypothetical protein [uncultured Roseateles sp.]